MNNRMDRREFLLKASAGAITAAVISVNPDKLFADDISLKKVRFGIIGLGDRGTYLLELLLKMPATEVTAVCDIVESKADWAIEIIKKLKGSVPAAYTKDQYDYRNLLKRDDVDAVLIATSIKWHGIMSIDAMNAGKHVASEVPACRTLDECRGMVDAKEKNNVHYMMLENYVYSEFSMSVLNMVKAGLFGEPYYGECGYIHEYKVGQYNPDGSLNWRGEVMTTDYGNHYPTHSGGPVFKWLAINDGDRLERVTCYTTSPNRTAPEFYEKRFGKEKAEKLTWKLGEMTTCLIKTAKGKVIKMDLDVQSNRPHSFYYLLQGTKGIYDNRFGISLVDQQQDLSRHPVFKWAPAENYLADYVHPLWKNNREQAQKAGHGGGDYFVIRDFVNMVRYDREPWIDVYDAAAWSSIYQCSQHSLDNNNAAIELPDFTHGRWKDPNWRNADKNLI